MTTFNDDGGVIDLRDSIVIEDTYNVYDEHGTFVEIAGSRVQALARADYLTRTRKRTHAIGHAHAISEDERPKHSVL